jgi:hypothetical protein
MNIVNYTLFIINIFRGRNVSTVININEINGSWIYNYLIKQSVRITTNVVRSNPTQARCTRYNIMW